MVDVKRHTVATGPDATGLAQLGRARDNLRARTTQVLHEDERVAAAWLCGAHGRQEADEWSDLDLHVAVADEQLPAILAEHEALFARCGHPLLVFGGLPSNSMPGGHFWLVQYEPWMLEIDWNIGPVQEAVRPAASLLLFDRVGVPLAPPLPAADESRRRAEAEKQLPFFWAMAPIAIKYAGRGHTRLAVQQVKLLQDAFLGLWRAVHHPERLHREIYHQNRPLEAELAARLPRFPPVIDPAAALAVIRALCAEVEALHPALAGLGAAVDPAVVAQVAALADLAQNLAEAGGSAPMRGSRR